MDAAGVAASHRGTSFYHGFGAFGPSTATVTIALAPNAIRTDPAKPSTATVP